MSTPYLLIKYHNSALAHETKAIPVAFRAKGRYNSGNILHRATVELVCAPKQAELADAIFGELTDEEHDVFRRGRNANVHTIPHSADRAQYQKATALEALFGWLYLQGRHERINELFNRMMEANDAA